MAGFGPRAKIQVPGLKDRHAFVQVDLCVLVDPGHTRLWHRDRDFRFPDVDLRLTRLNAGCEREGAADQ